MMTCSILPRAWGVQRKCSRNIRSLMKLHFPFISTHLIQVCFLRCPCVRSILTPSHILLIITHTSALCNLLCKYGEIVVFQKSDIVTCLVNVFRVVKRFSHKYCTEKTEILSFVEVEYAGYQKEISITDILNKLFRIDLAHRVFLSVIVDHFEHD